MSHQQHHEYSLPAELWTIVWSHASRRQLCRLALVCRLFRAIVQPALFRRIETTIKDLWFEPKRWVEVTQHLCRIAAQYRALPCGALVEEVADITFRGSSDGYRCYDGRFPWITNLELLIQAYGRAFTSFRNSLPHFRHLRVLELSSITVDTSLRQILGSVESLKTLRLWRCEIDPPCGQLLLLENFTLHHHEYYGRGIDPEPVVTICAPEQLRELKMNVPRVLLNGFLSLGVTFTRLQTLIVTDWPNEDLFFPFLRICPNATELRIQCGSWSLSPSIRQDPEGGKLLPMLSSLSAPHSWVRYFARSAPGRDMTEVNLRGLHWESNAPDPFSPYRDTLEVLHQCDIPLRTLRFTLATWMLPELIRTVSGYWPGLCALDIIAWDQWGFSSRNSGFGDHGPQIHSPSQGSPDLRTVDLDSDYTAPEADTISRPPTPHQISYPSVHAMKPSHYSQLFHHEGVQRREERQEPACFESLLTLIKAGGIEFSPSLECLVLASLHLARCHDEPADIITSHDLYPTPLAHDVIRLLGAQLPALQRLQLGDTQRWWTRDARRHKNAWWDGIVII
ncbi:unnamed protein product [Mycena citricolor]|uniref:F-box domain-containing protein n=1 Tax=Mycena citricolor TaxID=2018698 RepID=A0AAD2HD42_9AGAR|nr:unnamed protein product [Mycena citricolor]